MDNLFLEIIGKPTLKPPKIITIVADDFSFSEDQARFLKATLAIPSVKQLPLDNVSKRLVQIGPLLSDIDDQVRKLRWAINQYECFGESICDRMDEDLSEVRNRSVIFINDVSRLELSSLSSDEPKKLLLLADKLRRNNGHFIVMLYQNSWPNSNSTLLRNLQYISDAFVRVKVCKIGYFIAMWWQTIPTIKTLMSPKVETSYQTCKIGKFYWSSELLCFYDQKKVAKNYDLENDRFDGDNEDGETFDEIGDEEGELVDKLAGSSINYPRTDEKNPTLPFIKAQNPEQSRIFYYPDKDDDIDEDDPDNDLGI